MLTREKREAQEEAAYFCSLLHFCSLDVPAHFELSSIHFILGCKNKSLVKILEQFNGPEFPVFRQTDNIIHTVSKFPRIVISVALYLMFAI